MDESVAEHVSPVSMLCSGLNVMQLVTVNATAPHPVKLVFRVGDWGVWPVQDQAVGL